MYGPFEINIQQALIRSVEKVRQRRYLPSPKRLRAGRSPLGRAHVLLCTLRASKVRDKLSNFALGLAGNSRPSLRLTDWTDLFEHSLYSHEISSHLIDWEASE